MASTFQTVGKHVMKSFCFSRLNDEVERLPQSMCLIHPSQHWTGLNTPPFRASCHREVNLTCDAWQASNVDGYFMVTGHWIEEQSSGQWELEHTVLVFMRMNTAHNWKQLVQSLFKICLCLGIIPKV